jgi:pimeloyl-ACP methyl ester carboxylesterase
MILETPRGNFSAITWGDPSGSLVLALHGFPDEPTTFERLAPLLEQLGCFVVAPYLRGYGNSVSHGPYGGQALALDIVAMIETLGARTALLLGHDFGAQAAFALFDDPQRARVNLSGLVTLSLPHPGVIPRNMLRHPRQLRMSAYVGFFQLRGLADWAMRRDHFAAIDVLWRRWSPGLTVAPERKERVKAALASGWPAPIRHYREGRFGGGSPGCINVPWLHLMGADDGCTLPEMRIGQERFAGNRFEQHILDGVGHFVQLEAPTQVAEAMRSFLHFDGAPVEATASISTENPSHT